MKQIWELAKGLEEDILDSLESPKALLSSLFSQLKLKEKPFSVFVATTEEEIESLCDNVKKIDGSLERRHHQSVNKGKEGVTRVLSEPL